MKETTLNENRLVKMAIKSLENRLSTATGEEINRSELAIDYFKCQLLSDKNEVFAVLFLNNRGRKLYFEKMFKGTINACAIYIRSIVQKALEVNAAAIIVGHNHLSGNSEPSGADIESTRKLKEILELIDVKLLDHIIVSSQNYASFAKLNCL